MVIALVAVLAAMRNELAPFRRALSLQSSQLDGLPVYTGAAGDREVVAAVTRIGTKAAAETTERVLGAAAVDHVVVIGLAGSLDRELPIGHLVVPEIVIEGSTGRELRPVPMGGYQPAGKLRTGDEFILDADELARLRAQGVIALDMETAAIGVICERHGRPWSVFRAISDSAADHPDASVLGMVKPDGSPDPRGVARFVLTRPWKIPFLLRLGRGSQKAVSASVGAALAALGSPP